jgi:ribonuclease BN (tRNA processing enzyme)
MKTLPPCGVPILLATTLLVAASISPGPSGAAAGELRVTLLGTGSPVPSATRFSQSTLVEAGDQKLVFDMGRCGTIRLAQLDFPLSSIDAHFITHFHSDHLDGFTDLWGTGWLPTPFGSRTSPMVVYRPAGTVSLTENLAEAFAEDIRIRIADERLPPEGIAFEARDIEPGVVYENGGVSVTNHHTFPEEAGRIFSMAEPKLAAFSHIIALRPSQGLSEDLDTSTILERTWTTYDGPLVAGEDLMPFVIDDDEINVFDHTGAEVALTD